MNRWSARVERNTEYLEQIKEWENSVDPDTWNSLPHGVKHAIFVGQSQMQDSLKLWKEWADKEEKGEIG